MGMCYCVWRIHAVRSRDCDEVFRFHSAGDTAEALWDQYTVVVICPLLVMTRVSLPIRHQISVDAFVDTSIRALEVYTCPALPKMPDDSFAGPADPWQAKRSAGYTT